MNEITQEEVRIFCDECGKPYDGEPVKPKDFPIANCCSQECADNYLPF
jgi:hypothetical protein